MIALLLAFLLGLALPTRGLPQGALEIPANDGWVTDLAGMLSPDQERSLEALMESYRAGSGQEIALLTVPSLRGRTIEELGLETARAWGIGDREKSAGALLVVARDDRKLRIEVGRGLEGALPDVIAGRIIRDVIAPEFRAGDYPGGLRAGIEAIHAALGGDYAPLERSAGGRDAAQGVASVFVFILILIVIAATRRRGRMRAGLPGGVLPWILASQLGHRRHGGSFGSLGGGSRGGGFGGGGGFSGFGGGGGFSGGGASGGW